MREGLLEETGLGESRVEHVGSTAVPGLPAKPILDIDLGLEPSDDLEALVARLVRIGFIDRGQGEGGIGRLLVWESAPQVRAIHLHVLSHGSNSWRRDLAFRDALRSDAELRARYADLKRDLAVRHASDRRSYREGKDPFIREALRDLGFRD